MSTNSEEKWRAISTVAENLDDYLVSSHGRILSCRNPTPKELKPTRGASGYLRVTLTTTDGELVQINVHRLVAAAFLGPRPTNAKVYFLDCNKKNLRADNLEYRTPRTVFFSEKQPQARVSA